LSANDYVLPLKEKDLQGISKRSSPAHVGKLKHSIDFFMSEGTSIYASLGGLVAYVKQNSSRGGPHRRYWHDGNRIVIKHRNGEYSAYEHLKYRGSKVKKGQRVKKGQLIGYSGNTGYSFSPHLHFEVFINPDEYKIEGDTVPVNFTK